ncbi:MAG: alpha/beta hydrolase [Anaerolineae bacterium]|nr:alpha/beta hydrolase [Anaerolineae bacterium]
MKRGVKIALGIVVGVLAILLVGPFLVPVPDLTDTVPPEALADPDSRFVEVDGVRIHTKQMGEGTPVMILLHGFGASTFSWREVMAPLAEIGTVIAFDRPAFGLTERPMRNSEDWPGYNPYSYEAQPRLTVGLMDALGVDSAILIGNSAGGTVSALTAVAYPERVDALVLVDAAVYVGGGSPSLLRPFLATPQMRHLGPLVARRIRDWGIDFGRSAWHDPDRIPDEFWEGYQKPLRAENWDRALWELTSASERPDLVSRLDELTLPVLVITGDDDRIVPTEQSIRLAGDLPNADLVVLEACGHVPQEECPGPWLEAVEGFINER